jgi:hypothetical protein
MRLAYSTEQGIIFANQGILSQEQVISPAKTEINAGRSFRYAQAGYSGGTGQLRPGRSKVDLLCNRKSVVDLNAEVPDGALNLGVAEQ